MKPFLRSSLALVLFAISSACAPVAEFLGSNPSGKAQLTYGVARGDTAGFDLSAFSTRHISAISTGEQLQITLEESGRDRTLQLTVTQPEVGTCPLETAGFYGLAPGAACGLLYLQETEAEGGPLQARVTGGSLTLSDYGGSSVAFSLEATLQSPAGGSFTVRVRGDSQIERY